MKRLHRPSERERPEPTRVDLRGAGFDAWLAFVFDHPGAPTVNHAWYWYEKPKIEVDPREQVAHLGRLFGAPEVLRERFTVEQVDQGLWFLFGGYVGDRFMDPLWDASVPWTQRRAAIAAFPELYRRLLDAWGPYREDAPFMIADFLVFGYDCGNRLPDESAEDRRVQDAWRDALLRMLREGGDEARRAALHGLGHLRHPDGFAAVGRWLAETWVDDAELREYAERVAAGEEIL